VSGTPKIGFVFEQTLGHVTHAHNLQAVLADDQTISPRWIPVEYPVSGVAAHIPVFSSNWTVRAGLRARRALRAASREGQFDALFIHTQVPAVLVPDWLRRIPTIVSIDATPIQYDELGAFYDHEPGGGTLERLKWKANRACFQHAKAVVSWSSWAKQSLVDDYEVPAEKVTVIPPGVWLDQWTHPSGRRPDAGVVRILFVGADLVRKGGMTLVAAFRKVLAHVGDRAEGSPSVELHLVTKTPHAPESGIHVHADMTPNSPELLELFRRCDVFCLPTRADMLALVLCEAGAAGLPLVSTPVGGISEIVKEGETGLFVPPDDIDALAATLIRLVEDPALRHRLGANAAAAVEARFNARKNAEEIVALLKDVARPQA